MRMSVASGWGSGYGVGGSKRAAWRWCGLRHEEEGQVFLRVWRQIWQGGVEPVDGHELLGEDAGLDLEVSKESRAFVRPI